MESKISIRRHRSGCWNCKGRKRKCPEEFPACSACVKRNLRCDYGVRLIWKDDAELLGIAFGRAGLKNRHGYSSVAPSSSSHYLMPITVSSRLHWLNTTSEDVAKLYTMTGADESSFPLPWEAGACSIASIPIPLRDFPDLDGTRSRFLLKYYIRIWSRRQVLFETFDNPYQRVVLPLCQHSPGLMDMVIAFASHDIRNQLQDDQRREYSSILLYHKSRSLQHIRQLLADSQWATSASQAMRDSLLLTIVLHARLEITNNSTSEWVIHVKGALSGVRHCRKVHGEVAFSREVLDFATNFLVLEGILHATTNRAALTGADDPSCVWLAEIGTLLPELTVIERSHVNGYTGISPEVLEIIALTTSTIRMHRQTYPHKVHGTQTAHIHHIHDRLEQLHQWSDDPDEDSLVNLNAAAFKEAAWIYWRHGLLGESCDSPAIQGRHLPRLLALLQSVHRQRSHPVGSQPYPMWALFMAACVAQEDTRSQVMDRFVELWEMRPYSNVPVMTAAVKAIWKKIDLKPTNGPGLVWESTIHRLGWMVALT